MPRRTRDRDREERLKGLLRQSREMELRAKMSSWDEDADIIMKRGAVIGCSFYCYHALDRAMTEAKRLIQLYEREGMDFPSGTVVVARTLRDAKGRRDRVWHAPEGGVWLTLTIHPDTLKEHTHLYALSTGVACCETIRCYGVETHVKWVNDIHVNGRKIGGILIEGYTSKVFKQEYLLIGVGINVNNNCPEDIEQGAESILGYTGVEIDLDAFIASLMSKLSFYLGMVPHYEQQLFNTAMESQRPANPVVEAWRTFTDTIGRKIIYGIDVMKEPLFEAEVYEIDEDGSIMVSIKPDGHKQKIISGEILYI